MHNFHIKSILIGLGIGIILTSIVSVIYYSGSNTVSKPTEQEIIQMAKSYGLVDPSDFLTSQNSKSSTNKNEDTSSIKISSGDSNEGTNTNSAAANTASQQATAQKPAEQPVTASITINPGDTSDIVASKLVTAGLVQNKGDFVNKLTQMGLDEKINTGSFKFTKGTSIEDMIKKMTSN
ncbi:MAG: hypothetical protein Q8920_10755 [Bacillota bacterium]|nr:hypothetical protein [Bacillota bacterium]